MSVYRRKGRTEFDYDFWLAGRRFTGRTGETEKRAAERYEREIARPAAVIAVEQADKGPLTATLTIEAACARWFDEVGQHQAAPATTLTDLERICARLGPERQIGTITNVEVLRLIAQRRGDARWGNKRSGALISNSTVNRSVTRRLQAVLTRAARIWKIKGLPEIDWTDLLLDEPVPAPRQVAPDHLRRIVAALPEGYREFVAFAQATGLRMAECFIRWDQIDEEAGAIHVTQKGGRPHSTPITRRVAAILATCRGRHPVYVFAYQCQRRGGKAGRDLIIGGLYPVRYQGIKSAFARTAKREGLAIKFHMQRHSRLIEVSRATGGLKSSKGLAGHTSITTTERYYISTELDELRAAAEAADAMFAAPSPAESPARTGTKSGTD